MTIVTAFNDVIINAKDILSEKEYDSKKAGIISQIVKKRVSVLYESGLNCAFKNNKNGYTVIKASPKTPHIDGNTAMNHELAHILFNSFEPRVFKTLKNWSNVYEDGKDIAFNVYHEAMNIIEDQRIESRWGEIYLGNNKDFIKTRKKLGLELKQFDTPSAMLLAERFFRKDLTESVKYPNMGIMIHDVEGASLQGTMILLKKIKPHLDEYIQSLLDKGIDLEKNKKELRKWIDEPIDNSKPTEERKSDEQKKEVEVLIHRNNIKKISDEISVDLLNRDCMNSRDDSKRFNGIDLTNVEPYDDVNIEDYDTAMKEAKIEAKIEMEEIKSMMESSTSILESDIRLHELVHKEQSIIDVDQNIVNQTKKLLRTFKERTKDVISSNGLELDVSEYINMKANGYGDCFVEESPDIGLSICISIDGSTSMQGNINKTVQKIIGTIYKSIEDTKTIELKCVSWTSSRNGDISITNFNSFDDITYLNCQPSAYTPTHIGIKIGSDILYKMKGRRKLLMVITDGLPNYRKNNGQVSTTQIIKESIKSCKIALKRTPNISIIGVGHSTTYLKQMFKDKFIQCINTSATESFMLKTFRKEILRTMRR